MKARFFLLPAAMIVIASPVHAKVYLSVEQAQQLMVPGASFAPQFLTLSDAQVSAIESASSTNVLNRDLKVWKVSTGGWFIADEVVGKHDCAGPGL